MICLGGLSNGGGLINGELVDDLDEEIELFIDVN